MIILSELEKKLVDLQGRFAAVEQKLRPDEIESRIESLQAKTQLSDFWQNQTAAQSTMQEIGSLNNQLEQLRVLADKIQLIQKELAALAEGDQELLGLLQSELSEVDKDVSQLELKTFLGGKYDKSDAVLSIHAGQGGTEACDWVEMLLRMYLRYIEKQGWQANIVHELAGTEAGLSTVTVEIKGIYAYGYLKYEHGTHRLVRNSPFNAAGLRQTSFAGVEVVPVAAEDVEVDLKPEDIEFSAVRSAGAGGQNVNKVATSVRLVHKPTGIAVTSSTGRTQPANREAAMRLLKAKLWQKAEAEKEAELQGIKGEYKLASWGNQIRNYVLSPYKLVKDVRTGEETAQADAVLDGDLAQFIEAEIRTLQDR